MSRSGETYESDELADIIRMRAQGYSSLLIANALGRETAETIDSVFRGLKRIFIEPEEIDAALETRFLSRGFIENAREAMRNILGVR